MHPHPHRAGSRNGVPTRAGDAGETRGVFSFLSTGSRGAKPCWPRSAQSEETSPFRAAARGPPAPRRGLRATRARAAQSVSPPAPTFHHPAGRRPRPRGAPPPPSSSPPRSPPPSPFPLSPLPSLPTSPSSPPSSSSPVSPLLPSPPCPPPLPSPSRFLPLAPPSAASSSPRPSLSPAPVPASRPRPSPSPARRRRLRPPPRPCRVNLFGEAAAPGRIVRPAAPSRLAASGPVARARPPLGPGAPRRRHHVLGSRPR